MATFFLGKEYKAAYPDITSLLQTPQADANLNKFNMEGRVVKLVGADTMDIDQGDVTDVNSVYGIVHSYDDSCGYTITRDAEEVLVRADSALSIGARVHPALNGNGVVTLAPAALLAFGTVTRLLDVGDIVKQSDGTVVTGDFCFISVAKQP